MHHEIAKCRICRNENLKEILDLGFQAYTGIFPKLKNQEVPLAPLVLVKCTSETPSSTACGLVQLKHNFNLSALYGNEYGYKSSLNNSMVMHLQSKVKKILDFVKPANDSLIIDVGSNDGTTLKAYPAGLYQLVGVDPTGDKFRGFYPGNIDLISNFFSSELIKKNYPQKKAKIITSFSVFYDLEDPLRFAQDIYEILDDSGVWFFEQSYLPLMCQNNSFDTICHEHLEYYSYKQIDCIMQLTGFKVIDIEFNAVNGGSISVAVAKKGSPYSSCDELSQAVLLKEKEEKIDELNYYHDFSRRIILIKKRVRDFINRCKDEQKSILGLGASTKGNVILQYCDINQNDVAKIGEVSVDKLGCYTPGTLIPIVHEDEVLSENPDFIFVLPWHFRQFFETNNKFAKFKLIYPLSLF